MFWGSTKTEVVTDRAAIEWVLDRGVVANILPSKEAFMEVMTSGERLRFYIGADPTAPSLHLGHAGNLLLLEEFRALGHEVIVLFGDFTAQIGDPSGRTEARKPLTPSEIAENMHTWEKQIRPIFGEAPKVKRNSAWLAKLNFEEILGLAGHFTVQQMIERDMFERRMRDGHPIFLHEFLYPLMQGYDSVAMDVDVELCGTDQTFNALAGRTLQRKINGKEKFVVTAAMLQDSVSGEMMSKSKGTGVFLNTTPVDMYGGIMAQSDGMIEPLFIHLTRVPLDEVRAIVAGNKRDAKMRTAEEIVALFHGKEAAEAAANAFVKTFSNKEVPEDVAVTEAGKGEQLVDVLMRAGVVASKTEFRRLVTEGAIKNRDTGEKLMVVDAVIEVGATYQVGKRRFIKVVVE